MAVQIGGIFDLRRFYFSQKGGLYMPEQHVHPQGETDSDQQTILRKNKGDSYENNRYRRPGRIQCRN